MKARLMHMSLEMRQSLSVHLWSVWDVEKIEIGCTRHKYERWTKWVYCVHPKTKRTIRFLWYEVDIYPEVIEPKQIENGTGTNTE